MKHARYHSRSFTIIPAAILLSIWISPAGAGEVVTLKWEGSGIREKFTGYRPHTLSLTSEAPPSIHKTPDGIVDPRFGSFKIGPDAGAVTISVIYEEKDAKPLHLYVDGNGKGDFADALAHDFTEHKFKKRDGTDGVSYASDATVQIPFASGPRDAHLIFFHISAMNREGQPISALGYYSDYGFVGEAKVGNRTIPVVLDDAGCTGDLRMSPNISQTPLAWFDINGNGKLDRGELVVAGKPFEVDGKWWAMAKLTPDATFEIEPSTKPALLHEGLDFKPGDKAKAFTATLLDGNPVKFPDDYKGKIVMIDFWATWCGPCVAEIPNVVKTYETYHAQGFEILGVTLDQENAAEKLKQFTSDKHMPWAQVYDGKGWEAAVAQQYGINSIPHMILVDGDTAAILTDNPRGEALGPAVEKALKEKKK